MARLDLNSLLLYFLRSLAGPEALLAFTLLSILSVVKFKGVGCDHLLCRAQSDYLVCLGLESGVEF